ncbi:MAG: nicotinate-nucleotide adenylyltransferase [Tissierellia bacterium]|nr:nicotinate-nucleotide adenylyltransferase [Tissierellia bacterium]
MEKIRIGIMGGTFDPIHNGHLILAEYSRTNFNLDKVLFIPTGRPPHKDNKYISSNLHRLNMTLLAINSNPYFELSTIEMDREKTTYTIDTIKYLQSKYKNRDFYFILGSDSLYQIDKWKDYENLLKICNFIVAKRPSQEADSIEDWIKKLREEYNSLIYPLELPLIEISSTQIRERVKRGLSIKYLVPQSVEFYIEKNKLYR